MASSQSLRWPDRHEGGFILPLTLWIVAILGLGIAAVNAWVGAAVENSRILQHRALTDLALADLRNELVYALANRPLTPRGLEVGDNLVRPDRFDFQAIASANYESSEAIAFDGRPYLMESNPNFLVRLHDPRGLINLNTITGPYLRRFLSQFNVPETYRNRLIDTLADWIDEDNATNPSGAEQDAYLRLGRTPPSNAAMVSPLEAQSILDWDSVPQLWEADRRSPLLTTCVASGFNPNTAPGPVLMSYVAGLTAENQAEILRKRIIKPFRNQAEFALASGETMPSEAFFYAFIPAPCVIVDVTDLSTNERVRISLSLAPFGKYQPWQVDYAVRVPTEYRDALDNTHPEVAFPSPETLYFRESGNNGSTGIAATDKLGR
jgi:hypothetical protein